MCLLLGGKIKALTFCAASSSFASASDNGSVVVVRYASCVLYVYLVLCMGCKFAVICGIAVCPFVCHVSVHVFMCSW